VEPETKFVFGAIMALQAPVQGRKPGPRAVQVQEVFQRDLELQDTAQSLRVEENGRSEQSLEASDHPSLFDLAREKAFALLPPRWNRRPFPLGLAVPELKAALALMILRQHNRLLNKSPEVVESTET
jgi:hypothetical protein